MGTGARTKRRDCPFCGERYTLTNWMRLHDEPLYSHRMGCEVHRPTDTHERACAKRLGVPVREEPR